MNGVNPSVLALTVYLTDHARPPQVNLNGESGEALSSRWEAVKLAAEALEGALRATHPHGRDFQTVADPAEALASAQAAHWAARDVANTIIDYANAVRSSLADQGFYGGAKISK